MGTYELGKRGPSRYLVGLLDDRRLTRSEDKGKIPTLRMSVLEVNKLMGNCTIPPIEIHRMMMVK